MEIIETKLKDLLVLKPKVFEDERGYFFESYNQNLFKQAGLNIEFVQDNQSLSQKGVLRGLHFQNRFIQFWVNKNINIKLLCF